MTANIKHPAAQVAPWVPRLVSDTNREIDRSRNLDIYTVATLPDPAPPYRWIFVSDEAGGPAAAINNGSDWLRFPDGAVVT